MVHCMVKRTTRSCLNLKHDKQTCLTCNEKKDTDSVPHDVDDLGKCSVESEETRLSKQNKIYPKDENH